MMSQDFYINTKLIDNSLTADPLKTELADVVIKLIEEDESLKDYFLKRVRSIQWFSFFKKEEYFDPQAISFDSSGNANFWKILEYLEHVSKVISDKEEYGKELIKIIDDLVRFSIKKRKINNYHIWWYCVRILNNMAVSIIKEELPVEKFKSWLSVWTDHALGNDLTISDIGEKLLPKFLNEDFAPDFSYAEYIIYSITKIKIGGKTTSLTKRDDTAMEWQIYWIRDAFKKNAKVIGERCSIRVIYELADRLSKSLAYKQKNHYSYLDIGESVYRVKVSRILKIGLKPTEFEFSDDAYECSVTQFSREQLESIDRKNDFWALHNLEPELRVEDGNFNFTALSKEIFLEEIIKNLPKTINWPSEEKFHQKILSIYEGLFSDYSHIWCASLKNGPEHGDGAEDILTVILRDILYNKCAVSNKEGKQVFDSFLKENKYQFPIFRRLVLFCCDSYWQEYNEYFIKIIDAIPTVLTESDLEVEMFDVLQNHSAAFSSVLKEKLKELIVKIPQYYMDKGDEKLTAYWQYKWLSPLRNVPEFASSYEQARQKAEPKDGKPFEVERSAFKGGVVIHKSPVSQEEIMKKPLVEIVKYLSDFKGADFWHGAFEGEPDKEGLADVLQSSVRDEPKKFTDNINAFLITDYFYLHRIFRGLKEAWNGNKDIDWNSIFDFSISYLKRGKDIIVAEAIKAQGEDIGKGQYIWIVEALVELIADGSSDDKRAFDPQYFDKVEQIFDLVLPLLKGKKKPDKQSDALTYALNTTLGRTIRAYVSFSLRVTRATQKKKENWGIDKYERFFHIGIDGYIWFGCYLPQMKYLDKDYTTEKINLLVRPESPSFEWQMFMEGYLTGSKVYKDLYALMRKNYTKALEGEIFKGRADERLVEHICIGYLQFDEALDFKNSNGQSSLFWQMLDEVDSDEKRKRWEVVAGFFWSISGKRIKKEDQDEQQEASEDIKKKIIDFWSWTFKEKERLKVKLVETYELFLSSLAELTIWLDKIDETREQWLLLSAPYVEIQHRSPFFIEYLTKFTDEDSIKRIGTILTKVLENATPTFREEEIQLIVERLYEIGKTDSATKIVADNICNTYGRRGVHFLRDLFYKYQSDI